MKPSRRQFIQKLGAGAAGLSFASPLGFSSVADSTEKDDSQVLFIGDDISVVDTTLGKVRGYILRDIHHFLGIPYGEDTSGENRFMPPQKPKPWTNIYPAIWYGNSAPQDLSSRWRSKENTFRCHWYFDDVSENCLSIDVYTPGINDNKKRPVIVWLHGGGFRVGNAHEQEAYRGFNLAKYGDVVFCAPNHRLGPLGYSDFSVAGDKFAASGNVGMLDIVASLEWVHDNIANFGGDPSNVTIIGQSGGGSKVFTTIAMPAAKGLVHKAVVLSGRSMDLRSKELKSKAGEYILKEAGLNAGQMDELLKMPWKEYYDLALIAAGKFLKDAGIKTISPVQVFIPQIDGKFIPQHPYYHEASPNAAEIPMIICTTASENSPSYRDSSLESISFDGIKQKIVDGGELPGINIEKAGEIVEAYSKAFPNKKPVEIWGMITTDRQRVVLMADAKSKQKPPVFTAWFGWQPPLFDNRMRPFHMLDICFWFYNTDDMLSYTGGGSKPRELAKKMAGSLLQFMKTGDPNGGGLPHWPRYTPEKGELMFLDDVSVVQNDPDREARKSLPDPEGYFNIKMT